VGAEATGGGRVRALDGVRALAVLAVLGFHGGLPALPGGFLGVDAFFVLSGFLITGLLLAEHQRSGRVVLSRFWGRRVRRLLPALLLVLVGTIAAARLVLSPDDLARLRLDALGALGYVANWRMLAREGGDYFDQSAPPSPLQHTWSLGIEEQFYLLWPLVAVLVLRRRRSRGALLAVAGAGALASTAAMALLYRSGEGVSRVYYGTDTRAAPLLVGCALAVLLSVGRPGPGGRRLLGVLAAAGVVGIGWAWTHATGASELLYRGGFLLVALAVAAVLAHATVAPDGWTARALSVPPLPGLGRISYGVYLWHFPVFLLLSGERVALTGLSLLAVRTAVTLVLALASFVLVEEPVRRRLVFRGGQAQVAFGAAVAVTAAAVVVGTAPVRTAPLPTVVAIGPPPAASRAAEAPAGRRPAAPVHRRHSPPRVAVFGDSVALSLTENLPAHPGLEVIDHAVLGCGVVRGGPLRWTGKLMDPPPHCAGWRASWASRVRREDPDVAVFLVGRWEVMDRVHDGRWTSVLDPSFARYLASELDRAVAVASARGARVVLCTAPYYRRGSQPDGRRWPEDEPARVDRWNAVVRQVAARHPGTVRLVELGERVGPTGDYSVVVDGVRVRSDGVHFSTDGSRWLAPWLLPQWAAAAYG
jgi:peptidoglycan/LPS O-acetylase OafA/YrhL